MRFALFGDHPDGVAMARAVAQSGRHSIEARGEGRGARESLDFEEVLADPSIEAVIVATPLADRPAHLRRALQSERHVLCVYPPDETPDIAYEAAMIQGDTGCVLLPLLPWSMHPAIRRLAELMRENGELPVPPGERNFPLLSHLATRHSPLAWDVLRSLGGEIVEVIAFAHARVVSADEPLLLAGRYESSGLFQATLLPAHPDEGDRYRITAYRGREKIDLDFASGWQGRAHLSRQNDSGESSDEAWESWDPWPAMLDVFDAAVSGEAKGERRGAREDTRLSWQTAIRSLELDDAVRRSLQHRRATTLEYPEISEEVGFKGTMTLAGCGLLWGILLLVVLSRWFPWLGWAILPILAVFLGLQLLRWIARGAGKEADRGNGSV